MRPRADAGGLPKRRRRCRRHQSNPSYRDTLGSKIRVGPCARPSPDGFVSPRRSRRCFRAVRSALDQTAFGSVRSGIPATERSIAWRCPIAGFVCAPRKFRAGTGQIRRRGDDRGISPVESQAAIEFRRPRPSHRSILQRGSIGCDTPPPRGSHPQVRDAHRSVHPMPHARACPARSRADTDLARCVRHRRRHDRLVGAEPSRAVPSVRSLRRRSGFAEHGAFVCVHDGAAAAKGAYDGDHRGRVPEVVSHRPSPADHRAHSPARRTDPTPSWR